MTYDVKKKSKDFFETYYYIMRYLLYFSFEYIFIETPLTIKGVESYPCPLFLKENFMGGRFL